MTFIQVISILLSFTISAMASTATAGIHLANAVPQAVEFGVNSPFLITDVKTDAVTYFDPTSHDNYHNNRHTNRHTNTSISFTFTDPNSNTSTTCANLWVQNSTAVPTDYVLCSLTNVTEYFSWEFTSYTAPNVFQIRFAHIFYSKSFGGYEEMFSAPTNFTLDCANADGRPCELAKALSPVSAPINAISG